jgi:2-polyprenyl-6-methoxyphenol hydroxylase-like FAD-dependent oxidoreductase
MSRDPDVVVIGGGVAGCAIAARLAEAGYSVTVLEREVDYADRVRGEGMVHWGFEAATEMGLDELLISAPGATFIRNLVMYDERFSVDDARARSRDLGKILPGIPGMFTIGHPEIRQALADGAATRGATIVRGIRNVRVTPGDPPVVRYQHDGAELEHRCRLVIGADGKDSSTRRALGVELKSTTPQVMLTGMLVDDHGIWDRSEVTIGVHGSDQLYVFPRLGALRLYVGRRIDASDRFTGPDRQRRMLEAFRVPSLPDSDELAKADPIGPCATFPMTDTWTERPFGEGVVVVGDAAGWSNPVTGQGLAIAMRDAKVLTDLLMDDRSWEASLFREFAAERFERMRRLRFASALTDLLSAHCADDRGPRCRRMERRLREEPVLGAALDAVHRGPWRVPEEAFEPSILTTLALA